MSSEAQQEQVSQERELARLRAALESIGWQVDVALRLTGHKAEEARMTVLENAKKLVDRGLRPLNDDAILQLWDDAEWSEGYACEALGVDRLMGRAMLNKWREG